MGDLIGHLRKMVLEKGDAGLSDARLMEEYITRHEAAAIAALVRRYSKMVWGVCYRILGNPQDAEDAFQTTFLVLVRKAGSVKPPGMVGNWLYGVAQQTARNARRDVSRRLHRERPLGDVPCSDQRGDSPWRDLLPVLDQEVGRLPHIYRVTIVLCDLECKSRKEAARYLGIPEGTVAGRLARARTMLAKRLARHAPGMSPGALAAAIAEHAPSACLPPAVISSTLKAVYLVASGKTAASVVSANVGILLAGVLNSMLLKKLTFISAMCLGLAVAGVGVVALSPQAAAQKEVGSANTGGVQDIPEQKLAQSALPMKATGAEKKAASGVTTYLVKVPSPMDGFVQFIGTEIKVGEKVPPNKSILAQLGKEKKEFRRLQSGDAVVEGQFLARLADDPLENAELNMKAKKLSQSMADADGSKAIAQEAESKYTVALRLFQTKAIAEEDLRSAKATLVKLYWDGVAKERAVETAQADLRISEEVIERHNVRGMVGGVIRNIYKRPGEAVRKFETILEIEVTEKEEK